MWWCICCCSGAGFLLTGCIALIVIMDNILEMKAEAEKNGCQNITLEEINKVIDDYRINKKEF